MGGPGRSAPSPKKRRVDSRDETVALNRKARFRYEILESIEAGIVLEGSEVKAVREKRVNISDAYVRIDIKGEGWLINCHISTYSHSDKFGHDPDRSRKILLHKKELKRYLGRTRVDGLAMFPLKLYFKGGKLKVLVGLGKGKKLYDKRQKIREREDQRKIARALKTRLR